VRKILYESGNQDGDRESKIWNSGNQEWGKPGKNLEIGKKEA
jgi:hypothetical protein